ncbi:MAG: hypothetical protein ABI591_05700 [Kofleriaceae bacterium]
MRAALILILLAACQAKDGPEFSIGGGGGGGGGGGQGGVDAFVPRDAGLGDVVTGQVCLLTDARKPSSCATTGVGGYTVTLDGNSALTEPDGSFLIDSPTSSNLMWSVSGADIVSSLMSYSAVHRIPVMKQADYFDLANSNSVLAAPGFGDVFIHVTHAGTSVAGVAATTTPVATFTTLFDGGTPTTWTQVGTGTFGMVWVPGLAQGSVAATLTPQGGTATAVPNIPVGDQTLTWVSLQLP